MAQYINGEHDNANLSGSRSRQRVWRLPSLLGSKHQKYNLRKTLMKKRKIKRGDLLPWFLEDHNTLPAWYIKDCQEFFEWLKQSNKDRRKLN